MSYNILKKNVRFSGPVSGTIEGMVDTSTEQEIAGSKTFTHTVTSSADVMLSGSGKVSASFFYGDGSNLSGLPSGVGGSNTQVQFNDDGNQEGSADFTFATGSSTLSVNTGSVEVLSASNYVSASTYYGDGSNLQNVGAESIEASKIIGQISGSQISASIGLTTVGDNLAVQLKPNGGIVDDSGLIIDFGDLSTYSFALNDNFILGASGSGVGNVNITFQKLGAFLRTNATNINDGTLDNARLPADISVTSVTASDHVSASTFHGDGSNLTGITATATPAGSNTEIQFNDDGTTGASADFTFVTSSNSLFVSGNLSASHIVPNEDEQYDIGQDGLRYENLYAKFLNGGITFSAVNDEGATINKGDVVYIKGVSGGTPTVGLAACDDASKMPAFGLVGDGSITNGSTGRIVTFGRLNGFDTSAFSEGDILYVQTGSGETSGSLTNSAPTGSGNLIQNIGKVTNAAANGQVRVGGAGRTNATPNLDEGHIFIGNSTDQSVQDNTIYVSSSVSRVGINNTNPQHTLSVDGEISASSFVSASALKITGKSVLDDDLTIAATKRIYLDGTGVSANQGPFIYGSANTMYLDGDDNMYLYHDSRMSIFYGSSRVMDIQNGAISFDTTISSSNYISASAFIGDGSQLTNLPDTSPAGANTQIQFNDDGVFGASSKFTFSTSSATLEIAKSTTTSNEAKIWFHSGSGVFGDGSGSYIESDEDNHFVFDNNLTDSDFKFITRANSSDVSEKIRKLTIFGNVAAKGVALGNPTGVGGDDTVYVGNLTSSGDTIVRFRNINNNDVSLIMTGSTFGTTFTSEKLSGDFTLSHEGGDMSLHSSNNLNLSASSNIGITGSTGLVAEFDSGNSYLFKARKLHYKEIALQLASSLTGSSLVWLPMSNTADSGTQQYYHKFVAPFDGEIVKVMIRNDFAYNPSNYTLKAFKSSNSTEHPATEIDSGGLTFTLANTVKTVSYSTATFSAGDVLGLRLDLPGTFNPASNIGVNATIVIAYDELS